MSKLVKLRRRETGDEFELSPDLTVGRLPSCGIMLQDPSVSRQHARLEQRADGWWVADLGSSNGTSRNGSRGKEFALREGDLVTFGAVAFDVVATRVFADTPEADEIELLDSAVEPVAAEPEASVAAAPSRNSAADQERARIRRELGESKRASGLGDLSQQPPWVQLLVLLFACAAVYGLVLGVRALMAMMSPAA